MKPIFYFSLVDKNTGKEVYSSPAYTRDGSEAFDFYKIFKVLEFYFNRINSGIKSQLESPKVSDEAKAQLKFIQPSMFKLSYMMLSNEGGYSSRIIWAKELSDFSDAAALGTCQA